MVFVFLYFDYDLRTQSILLMKLFRWNWSVNTISAEVERKYFGPASGVIILILVLPTDGKIETLRVGFRELPLEFLPVKVQRLIKAFGGARQEYQSACPQVNVADGPFLGMQMNVLSFLSIVGWLFSSKPDGTGK
jgi:hypothetical protein